MTHKSPYDDQDDESLLELFSKKNDKAAIGVLFERHQACAYHVAFKFMHNQADAEDAVQKAFINVVRFASKQKDFHMAKAWLLKIVINTCKNEMSNKARRKKFEMSLDNQNETLNMPDIENQEQREILMSAVNQLPEKFKWPVWFTYYENMNIVEISKCLDKSESTIRSQIARGLEILETILSSKERKINSAAIILLLAQCKRLEKTPESLSPKIHSLLKTNLLFNVPQKNSYLIFSSKLVIILSVIGVSLVSYFLILNTRSYDNLTIVNEKFKYDFQSKQMPNWLNYDKQSGLLISENNNHGQFLRFIQNEPIGIKLQSNVQKNSFELKYDMRINPEPNKTFMVSTLANANRARIATFSIKNNIDPYRWINVKALVYKNIEAFYYNNVLSVVYVYETNSNEDHHIQWVGENVDIDNIEIQGIQTKPSAELEEFIKIGLDCLKEKNTNFKKTSIAAYKNIDVHWGN